MNGTSCETATDTGHHGAWGESLLLLLAAVLASWLAVELADWLLSARWFGPEGPPRIGHGGFHARVAFCASLVMLSLLQWPVRGPAVEPLLVAALCGVGVWLYTHLAVIAVLFTLGAGGREGLYALIVLLMALLGLGVLLVRYLPRRKAGRVERVAKLLGGVAVLLLLLSPWHHLNWWRMSTDERRAAAEARFGPLLVQARATVQQCLEGLPDVGTVESVSLSWRRNFVLSEPGQQRAFFDFDYRGSAGHGRATLGGTLVGGVAAAASGSVWLSGQQAVAEIYVYPDGGAPHPVRTCRFVAPAP